MAQHTSPNSSLARGMLTNTQPSPWFSPSVAKPEVIVRLGLLG